MLDVEFSEGNFLFKDKTDVIKNVLFFVSGEIFSSHHCSWDKCLIGHLIISNKYLTNI